MSIKVMTAVWEHSHHKGSELLLLLALADFAHDDGGGVFPSVETMGDKVRMSYRNVQYLLRKLVSSGELVEDGTHPSGTMLYRVNMPLYRSANFAARPKKGARQRKKGAQTSAEGAQAVAPDPSVIHQQPSEDEYLRHLSFTYRLLPETMARLARECRAPDGSLRGPLLERRCYEVSRTATKMRRTRG